MTENEIGTRVIEAAIAVHRELGPGLLETVYEVVLARELGYLLNFGEEVMRTGITRCVNGLEEQPLRLCGRRKSSNNRLLRRRDTVAVEPERCRTFQYSRLPGCPEFVGHPHSPIRGCPEFAGELLKTNAKRLARTLALQGLWERDAPWREPLSPREGDPPRIDPARHSVAQRRGYSAGQGGGGRPYFAPKIVPLGISGSHMIWP